MSTTVRTLTSLHPRVGFAREVLLAAVVSGLLGLALLASTPFVMVLGAGIGGLLLLGAVARGLAVDRATALFLLFVLVMVSFGRDFSYLHIEIGTLPLYATEMLLAVLLAVAARRLLLGRLATGGMWHIATVLLIAYIILGLMRLPLAVRAYGSEALRDAVICTYAIFTFLTAWLLTSRRMIRLLGVAVILGSVVASAMIISNALRGEGVSTTTLGVVRYGAGIQAFSATLAALLWMALWVNSCLSRRAAVAGGLLVAAETAVSLLLVQHRSQMLALVAGLGVIAAANPRRRRLGGLALTAVISVALLLLLIALGIIPGADHPFWRATVERAASSLDPGADSSTDWRMQVNRHVLAQAFAQPLTGIGFGPAISFRYTFSDRHDVDPHNSFVAVIYRLGVPTALFLFISLGLFVRRAWLACRGDDMEHRGLTLAALSGLAAMGIFAAFNVVLEGPYLGIFFWIPLGVLMRLTGPSAVLEPSLRHPL